VLRGPAYLVQMLTSGAFHLVCQFSRASVGSSHDENLAGLLTFDFLFHDPLPEGIRTVPKILREETLQACERSALQCWERGTVRFLGAADTVSSRVKSAYRHVAQNHFLSKQ
jgi:hypothetical protein